MESEITSANAHPNPYIRKLRAKNKNNPERKSQSANKLKGKKKKAPAIRAVKPPPKRSKNPPVKKLSTQMELGLYKKIFCNHFAKYATNEKANGLPPQKSFQNFYHHVVFASDTEPKNNQQKFSDYLKNKKDSDHIKLLDRTTKVLKSLSNMLDKDPKMIKSLDYSKVVNNVEQIKVKVDLCKKILQKSAIVEEYEAPASPSFNGETAFLKRIKMYEHIKENLDFEDTIEDNLEKAIAFAKSKPAKKDEMSIERANDKIESEKNQENMMVTEEEEKKAKPAAETLETLAESVDQLLDSEDVLLFLLQYLKDSQISLILKLNTNEVQESTDLHKLLKEHNQQLDNKKSGWELLKALILQGSEASNKRAQEIVNHKSIRASERKRRIVEKNSDFDYDYGNKIKSDKPSQRRSKSSVTNYRSRPPNAKLKAMNTPISSYLTSDANIVNVRQIANIESSPKKLSLPPPLSKSEIKTEPLDYPAAQRIKPKEHKPEKIKLPAEQKIEKLKNPELLKTKSSNVKSIDHNLTNLVKTQSVPAMNSLEKPLFKNAILEASNFLEIYDNLLQDSLHNISKYETNLENPLFNSSPSIKRLGMNGTNENQAPDSLFPKWLSSKKENSNTKMIEEPANKNIWSPKTLREHLPDANALNKILYDLNSQTPQSNEINENSSHLTNTASKLIQASDFSPSLLGVKNNLIFPSFLNGQKSVDHFKNMSPVPDRESTRENMFVNPISNFLPPTSFNLQDVKLGLQKGDSDAGKKERVPLPSGIIKPTPSYNPSPSFQPVTNKPRIGEQIIPPPMNENSNSMPAAVISNPAGLTEPKPQTFSPQPLPFLAANLQMFTTQFNQSGAGGQNVQNGPMLSFLNSIERKNSNHAIDRESRSMSIEPVEKEDKTPLSQEKESSRGFDAQFKSKGTSGSINIFSSLSEKWKDPQTPVSKAIADQSNVTNSPIPGNGTSESNKGTSRKNIILQ